MVKARLRQSMVTLGIVEAKVKFMHSFGRLFLGLWLDIVAETLWRSSTK